MLIANFASLHLHDLSRHQITSMGQACAHFRKPEVLTVATAFFQTLMLHCKCPQDVNPKSLIVAFGVTAFGVGYGGDAVSMAQYEAKVLSASTEFTATVQAVLAECKGSSFRSLSAATKQRFKEAATAQAEAMAAFEVSDIPVLCKHLETALEKMYLRQAQPSVSATELGELAFHIDRLRNKYRTVNADGLARFDAGRGV
jgi:hypothetical protein